MDLLHYHYSNISNYRHFSLKSEAFIVDDLPKTDKIYTDLKWFEQNFKGVMPLEIVIDTKKKRGVTSSLKTFERIDEFSSIIVADPKHFEDP